MAIATRPRRPRRRRTIPKLRPTVPGATGQASPPQLHRTPQEEGGTAADIRKLTPVQIGQAVVRQGGPKDVDGLAQAIAVAMCESGGNWDSVSRNPSGGTNRGGWQIDDKSHPEYSSQCLHSVLCSTDAMLKLSNGGKDFSIWACGHADPAPFRGAAQQALVDAGTVAERANQNPLLDALGRIGDVGAQIAQFFAGLGELLLTPDGWIRLGKVLLGAIVVLWGLSKLAGQLGGGKSSRGLAKAAKLIPAGRAVGAAEKAVAKA